MKDIKLKLQAQEMADLQKALLDIDADMITYEKFLTCVLIGMVCADLDAFKSNLLKHNDEMLTPEGIVQALQTEYGVSQEQGVEMLREIEVMKAINVD